MKLKPFWCCLLGGLLFLLTFAVVPTLGQSAVLKVKTGSSLDEVRAEVLFSNMQQVKCYGLGVKFDPTVYKLEKVEEGDFLNSRSPFFMYGDGQEPGQAIMANGRPDLPTGQSGSGVAAVFIFRRIGQGSNLPVLEIAQIQNIGNEVTSIRIIPDAPKEFGLLQNYPNPFNPDTTIPYFLAEPGRVKLVVYNATGQTVRNLFDGQAPAGRYIARWDSRDNEGRPVASGAYFCRLTAGGHGFTQKMILLK